MHPLDNEFFEEYKRLDKLCADLLSTNTGVREYIAQMEAQDAAGSRCVPFWGAEMNRLKRVHRIRNRLAHDYSVNAISDADDLSFLRRFHDDILCTQDPLALLRKAEQAANIRSAQKKNRAPSVPAQASSIPSSVGFLHPDKKTYLGKLAIGCFFVLLFLIFLLFLLL